jgi:hypothetical protein
MNALFAGGFIDIYTGAQPTSPDAAATGTLLATVYSDGAAAGLSLARTAIAGVISKLGSQNWSTNACVASGTAGYFRFRAPKDPGAIVAGGTITAAARAANQAVIVFTQAGHSQVVGNKIVTSGFTADAYNVHGTVVAITGTTFSVVGETVAGGAGDTAAVIGTYTYSVPVNDTGASASATAVRIDGAIGTSGAEMNLGSLTFTAGAPFVMAGAAFTIPQV